MGENLRITNNLHLATIDYEAKCVLSDLFVHYECLSYPRLHHKSQESIHTSNRGNHLIQITYNNAQVDVLMSASNTTASDDNNFHWGVVVGYLLHYKSLDNDGFRSKNFDKIGCIRQICRSTNFYSERFEHIPF